MQASIAKRALEIAIRDLRNCYDEKGILAGRGHFQQYWARDAMFASFGALALAEKKDLEIVRKNLELFISFMQNNHIPNLITRNGKASHRFLGNVVIDSNPLTIIVAQRYFNATNDKKFLKNNFAKLHKALKWLMARDYDKDNLVEEYLFSNWADTVLKFGEVFYSNVCYFKALRSFSALASAMNKKGLAERYSKKAEAVKEALNKKFWNGLYYMDWFDFHMHNYFASDGNMLAICWQLTEFEQANSILNFVKSKQLAKIPMKTNWPLYPFWRIPLFLLPFQAYHYHNGLNWPWLGCCYAIALQRVGRKKEARQQLKKIAKSILEQGICHEILDDKGKPVKSLLLSSEAPFAWTSGLYVAAYYEIIKGKKIL